MIETFHKSFKQELITRKADQDHFVKERRQAIQRMKEAKVMYHVIGTKGDQKCHYAFEELADAKSLSQKLISAGWTVKEIK
jgi:diphthamide synthase subunit DPH2